MVTIIHAFSWRSSCYGFRNSMESVVRCFEKREVGEQAESETTCKVSQRQGVKFFVETVNSRPVDNIINAKLGLASTRSALSQRGSPLFLANQQSKTVLRFKSQFDIDFLEKNQKFMRVLRNQST